MSAACPSTLPREAPLGVCCICQYLRVNPTTNTYDFTSTLRLKGHLLGGYVGMADEACVVRLARNRERTQTENRSNEQPQNQPRTIILTMSWFQISNSAYKIFPANQRPCKFSVIVFGLAIHSSFTKLLLSYRRWIIRQVLNKYIYFFLAIKELNWIRK